MEREVGMNGHDIVGGILVVKAGVDTIKSLSGLFRATKSNATLIPVYHKSRPARCHHRPGDFGGGACLIASWPDRAWARSLGATQLRRHDHLPSATDS
jgi:hypothetical protein